MIGIVLANTGSPASADPDDIESYLRSFLMDERIRQLPKPLWKYLLFHHILPKRKFSSAKRYEFIWTKEGSPLIFIQQSLAEKVEALLHENEKISGFPRESIQVRSAMSYGEPSIENTLKEFRSTGVETIILLPMYPQSAYSPTMAVIDSFWRSQDAIDWHPYSVIINNYHDDPGYISAIARSIKKVGFGKCDDDHLVLSLHAIPLKDEKAGDTYRRQVATSANLIAKELNVKPESITISYQSVFGPHESKWASPLSRDILKSWSKESFRVIYACPGFAIDCLETLYDIPHEMVPALEGDAAVPFVQNVSGNIQAACNTSGRFIWVPSLNDSDEHAALISNILERSITKDL